MTDWESIINGAMKDLDTAFPGRSVLLETAAECLDDAASVIQEEEESEDTSNNTDHASSSFMRTSSSSDVRSSTPDDSIDREDEESPPPKARGTISSLFRSVVAPSKATAGSSIPLVLVPPSGTNHSFFLRTYLTWPVESKNATRIALSPDGATLAVGTLSGEILIWFHPATASQGKRPDCNLRGHSQGITCLLWLNVQDLVSGSLDEAVMLWKPHVIQQPVDMVRNETVPSCMCLHPGTSGTFVIGSIDGSVRFWSSHLKASPDMVKYTDPVTSVAVSNDGTMLAVGSCFGIVVIYNIQALRMEAEVDCRNRSGPMSGGRNVTGLVWSRDNQYLCVSSLDSRVRVVHLADLSRRTKFKSSSYMSENLFNSAVFVAKERKLIGLSETGHICIWNVNGGSDTIDASYHCSLFEHTALGATSIVKPEVTASLVSKSLPTTFQSNPTNGLKLMPDTVLTFVADTSKRISICVELHPSTK